MSNGEKSIGVAVGDPINNIASILLFLKKWDKIAKNLPKFKKGEAFYATSNTNIKIVNETIWIVSEGKKARVLKSVDKENTWKVYNTPFIQGKEAQGIYSVDFYDEKNGIIVGLYTTMYIRQLR